MSGAVAARTPCRRVGLVGALVAIAVLAACAPPSQRIDDAWYVIDLGENKPRAMGERAEMAVASQLTTPEGRELRVVQNTPTRALVWELDLGHDSLLSFRPHPVGGECVFEVAVVHPEGAETRLYRERHAPPHAGKPGGAGEGLAREVSLSLTRFSQRRIQLAFRAEGEGCELAQWASPVVATRGSTLVRRRGPQPNLILVTLAAVRADALGAWGRTPTVTPAIDDLALRSDVWTDAFATANAGRPSLASLMTGLYPKNHRLLDAKTALDPGATTLAEVLNDAGFRTRAVIGSAQLGGESRLAQGFQEVSVPRRELLAETAINQAIEQLDGLEEPFFLWLHLSDAELPLSPPAPFRVGYRPGAPAGLRAVAQWQPFRELGSRSVAAACLERGLPGHPDLYAGEVAYLDRQVDRLLDFAASRGLLERSVVALVSDHGVNLDRRGACCDAAGLDDGTTRVPLLIHWPGQSQGRRIDGLVQHFDLLPTVLAGMGIAAPASDAVVLPQAGEPGRDAVFAQHGDDSGEMVRTSGFLLYLNRAEPSVERGSHLYDLAQDPVQEHGLAGTGNPAEAELGGLLAAWRAGNTAPRTSP